MDQSEGCEYQCQGDKDIRARSISSQSDSLCDCIDQSEASECSYSPDRDRKLYLAVFETKGEFPDIITVLSLSLWYPE